MTTFLFDLDGTLLAVDARDFAHAYFGELTRAFEGLLPSDHLAQNILTATARMQADTRPGSNNLEKFRREFEPFYPDVDRQIFWDRITEFYATSFDNIHSVMGRNEPLHRSVEYLQSRGYRVLLTTNPVFPQAATWKRIAWAGFTPESFEYVSTMENCSCSKPNIEYWQHVTTSMGIDPADAIAVGNDCVEDVSARLAGIATYLVTDYVIGDPASSGADHISDAAGFEQWVRENY
jgi:FMN phosphatase YigB (HAD superfamily)